MKTKYQTKITGLKEIAAVINYLDYQRSIVRDVNNVDCAFFNITDIPGTCDDSDHRIARSILLKLEREGYIKFIDNTGIKELEGNCAAKFLPKYKWIRFKYLFSTNIWEVTNPFWVLWNAVKLLFILLSWLWSKHKIILTLTSAIGGLLIYDWTTAWVNVQLFLVFLKHTI